MGNECGSDDWYDDDFAFNVATLLLSTAIFSRICSVEHDDCWLGARSKPYLLAITGCCCCSNSRVRLAVIPGQTCSRISASCSIASRPDTHSGPLDTLQ